MKILKPIIYLGLTLLFSIELLADNKEMMINKTYALKDKNDQQLSQLESQIKSKLVISLAEDSSEKKQEQEVKSMILKRKELLLRRDFLTQLVAKIATEFHDQNNLADFLSQILLKMSYQEALKSEANSPMWKFLSYLSSALKSKSISQEDPIRFVESYMNTSSISEPLPPKKFFDNRNYTDGLVNLKAAHSSRTQVGDELDSVLKQLDLKEEESVSTLKLSKKSLIPQLEIRVENPK